MIERFRSGKGCPSSKYLCYEMVCFNVVIFLTPFSLQEEDLRARYGHEDILLGLRPEPRRYIHELRKCGQTLRMGFHFAVCTEDEFNRFRDWRMRHKANMGSFVTMEELTPPLRRFLRDEMANFWDEVLYEGEVWVKISWRDFHHYGRWRFELETRLAAEMDLVQ